MRKKKRMGQKNFVTTCQPELPTLPSRNENLENTALAVHCQVNGKFIRLY